MESPFRVRRSSSPCAWALLGVLALQGCAPSPGSFTGGIHFSAPRPLGGLPPVEGAELLDASFAGTGVFESYDFVERQPVRVIVDRFSRPLIVGLGARPSGLRVQRLSEAGASDTSFGTGGFFLLPNDATETSDHTPRAADVRLDALDRILLFGTRTTSAGAERAVIVRLQPQGVLDPSFGVGGRAVLEASAGASGTRAVSLSADPLGGWLACADELGPDGPRMSVARFDENGVRDDDYGVGGRARGPEDEASVGARAVLDGAGRLVVAGSLSAEPGRLALWRFDAHGARDPGFGADGLVTASDRSAALGVQAVDALVDAAGRIVVLGQRARDLPEIDAWPLQLVDFKPATAPVFDALVWRFLPDGAPDPTFGDGGVRVLAFNSGPYVSVSGGLAGGDHFDAAAGLLQDDLGRLVVAGWSDPATWDTTIGWAYFGPTRPFLVRLTESGALDVDFHGLGHAQLGWDAHTLATVFVQGHLTSIARDAQGRWVLGGGSANGSSQHVWRIAP